MHLGERLAYDERKKMALREKENILSIITDGMTQGHSNLPYMGNKYNLNKFLEQHIQGTLIHHRWVIST